MQKYYSIFLVLFLTCICTACSRAFDKQVPLRFIDAIEIPHNTTQQGIQIGGLSSLYFDAETNTLYSITDDKGRFGGPVIHHFSIQLTAESLNLEPVGITKLGGVKGESLFPEEIIDAEAFDRLSNGHWLVSSEGIDVEKHFALPMLYEFTAQGLLVRRIEVPSKYLPKQTANPESGIRPNDAFEGLSISPDNKHLFLINEKALLQDGNTSTPAQPSIVRLVHKNRTTEGYDYVAEYPYILSELPNPTSAELVEGVLSISDLLTLDNRSLLVVEKSFLTQPSIRNTVRIYHANIPDSVSNVQDISSLASAEFTPVEKTLWTDLDDYTTAPGFPKLDNVEGIIIGPTLGNGNNTLLVVTDNNFSRRQKTIIYAFEIIDDP